MKDTDFRILKKWLEIHNINFFAADEFDDGTLFIIADFPISLSSDLDEKTTKTMVTISFDFDENDNLYSVNFSDFLDFHCKNMELVSPDIITFGEGENKIRLRLA